MFLLKQSALCQKAFAEFQPGLNCWIDGKFQGLSDFLKIFMWLVGFCRGKPVCLPDLGEGLLGILIDYRGVMLTPEYSE